MGYFERCMAIIGDQSSFIDDDIDDDIDNDIDND